MIKLFNNNKISFYLDEVISTFDLTTGVKTIDAFVSKIEDLSQSTKFVADPNNISESERDKLNSFKGDMFEVLAEIFFLTYSADPVVGLHNYRPVSLTDDFGVDATAVNVNGHNCVIQCKYRSNPMEEITYGDIAKTYSAGRELNHFSLDENNTLFLITTGKGANSNCYHVFGNKLRVIDKSIISSFVDNNQTFWEQAESIILDTLDYLDRERMPKVG